jgi:antitoxin PrlF
MEIISTVTSKGQITIPVQLRDLMDLESGDLLCFHYETGKPVTVKKQTLQANSLAGILRKNGNGKKLTQQAMAAARDAMIASQMES